MSDASTAASQPIRRAQRSRPYLWLLLLVPALALLGAGLYQLQNVPDGGQVTAVKLTTKQGMVGQAAEAVANTTPTSPDYFLKVFSKTGEFTLPPFKDTPIGNGLTWNLPRPQQLGEIERVEVWDYNSMWKDEQVDRLTMSGWSTTGQRFTLDLLGERIEAPKWAMPSAVAGGVLTLVVLLKFVWDQVI